MIREVQRSLSRLYSNLSVMSTLGIKPPGGCHYPLPGWAEFARLIQPLIERDLYDRKPADSITPPDLKQVYYTSAKKDAITLEFDQPVIWMDALAGQIYLDGEKGKVASGSVTGNVLTLKLKEASKADRITYLKESDWSQNDLILGANGIAALTFCDVPLCPPNRPSDDNIGGRTFPSAATGDRFPHGSNFKRSLTTWGWLAVTLCDPVGSVR